MKITIINGSPRKNGSTYKILAYFYELLSNYISSGSIEFINLIDLNINFCIGCQSCHRTGICVILEDRVEEIHDLIKDSDGLILGSPTYNSNVTGLFKSFYDRVHMTLEQLLYHKPCVIIVTYENMDGSKSLKILKEMVMNAGGYVIAQMLIKNDSYYSDPLTEINKEKIEKAVKLLINEMQKNTPPLLSRVYRKVALRFLLKRYIYKDKEHNLGIIKKWVEKRLI
uniref:Putative iron-sulfur flavoprotein n=1 Tax=uncultured bacterium contig00049 TaxID=1181534 RepID=A0A806JYR2_9BACT|nr:putative iron-sulfur flavoprotein [uncultured bacterium contig00049]